MPDLATRSEDGGIRRYGFSVILRSLGDSAAGAGLQPVQPKEWRQVFFRGPMGMLLTRGTSPNSNSSTQSLRLQRLYPELENDRHSSDGRAAWDQGS
ncbi:MAG: hypothetical protein R3C02_05655 [Planctomycetaceae bacterium]